MVVASTTSYDHFKNVFAALGGSRKTVVLVNDATGGGGGFTVAAVFAQEETVDLASLTAKPSTFDADFPSAIPVDSISVN